MTRLRVRLAAALLLPMGLQGCASAQRPIDYAALTRDAQRASAALCAQADMLVAAGRLDPLTVAVLEAQARAAVAALPAPVASDGPSQRMGAIDIARLQTIARQVRLTLGALAAIIPAALLPEPVAAALQVADALLDAFLALPAAASVEMAAR